MPTMNDDISDALAQLRAGGVDNQRRAFQIENCIFELRQSLIGGIEGTKAGRDLTKWADANERMLARHKQ